MPNVLFAINKSRRQVVTEFFFGTCLFTSLFEPSAPAIAGHSLDKWVCRGADCDPYVYDPNGGDPDNIADPDRPIPPGVAFENFPESWICPLCGTPKSELIPYDDITKSASF
jgi:rubredoxin